jgi:hypothetical protein
MQATENAAGRSTTFPVNSMKNLLIADRGWLCRKSMYLLLPLLPTVSFAFFCVKVSLASASHCFPYFCKFGVKQIEFGRLNQGKQWQNRKLVNLQERQDILKTK